METVGDLFMYTVVYACNNGYAKLAGISLLSLLQNNTTHDFTIYIVADNISITNRQKLESLYR